MRVQCPEQGHSGTKAILVFCESGRLHIGRHNRRPLSEGQRGMTGVAKSAGRLMRSLTSLKLSKPKTISREDLRDVNRLRGVGKHGDRNT